MKHISSKCIYPRGGEAKENVRLVLASKCKDQMSVFVWTAKRSLKHIVSGYCIKPKGELLVLHGKCDSMSSMAFKYNGNKPERNLVNIMTRQSVRPLVGNFNTRPGISVVLRQSVSATNMFMFESKCFFYHSYFF